jgi:LPS-assembly protein
MMLRTRFLITALFLCHQLPASSLVTSQLLAQISGQDATSPGPQAAQSSSSQSNTPCAQQAAAQDLAARNQNQDTQNQNGQETIICALQQEKDGAIYKLHGDAEIYYRGYILRADEVTYDSDTGEAIAVGHFMLEGGPNDDHIKASHGTYNLTAETGRFFDVIGTTGMRFHGKTAVLTSTAPFAFTGKVVEKKTPDHYLVYDGTITTCELPHPNWMFRARKVTVDVGGNAVIRNSSFLLRGIPILYFPYATHPVSHEARETGFLVPTAGRSSTNGNEIGDAFYWAINRTMDATIGAEYFSKRGWSQRGEFRVRPSDTSYVDLNYFGVIDRGISEGTGEPPLREGGQDIRLTAEDNFFGFRAVSNVDYLSSFLFRLAFNEVFTQAVNSEVKSQVFLAKTGNGYSLSGMVERYQNFFQQLNSDGTLTNPPIFDDIRILHAPSIDASSVDRALGRSPFYWSFDASVGGLSRSEPGFRTADLLGRFDFTPEISLPLQFHGWSLRPALALHETYYSERLVDGVAVHDATNRQALDASVELRPPALERVFDKEFLGRKWKHVIEPRAVYRIVTGVNDFANVLQFDERDILSNTHEVEYGFVTRLYAKSASTSQTPECETPMGGLAVGAAAPEQIVPWQRGDTLESQSCIPAPEVRELATWEISQKYFLDPTFGGALIPGERNVFTTTEGLTGIAFITEPRHLSPLVSRLRVATSSHTDTEWDLDYDFQLSRMNASTLLVNYNIGPFTVGAGDAFLQIPQTNTTTTSTPSEGTCSPVTSTTEQVTCKFQQFRVALGYGGLNRRGFSAATSFGVDAEVKQLQFATAQTTYNWNCCGMTLEYRRYAIANVRNENLFRFTFTLANIGSFGNLRRQERLY